MVQGTVRESPTSGVGRGLRRAFVILILLATNAVYAGLVAGATLIGAQADVASVSGTDRVDDLGALRRHAIAGTYGATAAEVATAAPGVAIAGLIPGIGNDVDVFRFVAQAGGKGTRFAASAVQEVTDLVPPDGSLATAFYRDGRLDFDNIEVLSGLAGRGREMLRELERSADELDEPIFASVEKIRRRTQSALATAHESAARARELLAVLPELGGRQEPKRYFLAFQAPSEARGSGGVIGVYGVLVADGGAIHLQHVGPILELNEGLSERVQVPGWFRQRYGDLLALEDFRQVNQALHFPTVGRIVLDMYENSTGRRLDGVVTLDPIVLEQMTAATGPLTGPGWDVAVTKKTARRVLLRDVYLKFGRFQNKAQNKFLNGLIGSLLNRIERGRIEGAVMAEGLATAVKWQHLKFFADEETLQAALARIEIDGDFTRAGTNVQAVFHNNFTGSKIDYYLWREQRTEVQISADGDATVTTTITLENRAPESPSSLLIRPLRRKVPNGHNRMTLNVLLPESARAPNYQEEGRDKRALTGRELNHPVIWNVVDIPSMSTKEIAVTYRMPDAVRSSPAGPVFEMTLWPQALARPDSFSFRLVAPSGFRIDARPRRRLQSDGSYVVEGRLFGPKTIEALLIQE